MITDSQTASDGITTTTTVATPATSRHFLQSTPSLNTHHSCPTEVEFALCLIGRKWCDVKHFDPKGTQCIKESTWKGEMPGTARHAELQRGCRKCTACHSKACKKLRARTKQRKAATGAAVPQTTATGAAVTQTDSTETSTEDIMSREAV